MLNNKIRLDSFLQYLKMSEFLIIDSDSFDVIFEGECSDIHLNIYPEVDFVDSNLSNYYIDAFFAPMGSMVKIFVKHEKTNCSK